MRINATVDILPKNSSYKFVNGWDFLVGDFTFSKKDDHTLTVSFSFESDLIKEDEVFGRVEESPHDLSEDLLKKEYELEILLDVITLSTATGLRISPVSYRFRYGSGSSSSSSSTAVSMYDFESVKDRFEFLREAPDNIQDALRFYRLNRLEEDGGERTTHLWSVVERLYGKQPDQKFLDDKEYEAIQNFINDSDSINSDKKAKLLESLKYINPVNTLDLLSERIKLKNSEGQVSDKEKKELLKEWKKLRGYQGHGEYVLRNENLQEILWDFEDTVELFLENHIRPKMYLVVAFEDGTLAESWKNSPSHHKVGKWNFTPIRRANISEEARMMEHLVYEKNPVYVIDYKRIIKVAQRKSTIVNIGDLDDTLKAEVEKIREDMNA